MTKKCITSYLPEGQPCYLCSVQSFVADADIHDAPPGSLEQLRVEAGVDRS